MSVLVVLGILLYPLVAMAQEGSTKGFEVFTQYGPAGLVVVVLTIVLRFMQQELRESRSERQSQIAERKEQTERFQTYIGQRDRQIEDISRETQTLVRESTAVIAEFNTEAEEWRRMMSGPNPPRRTASDGT